MIRGSCGAAAAILLLAQAPLRAETVPAARQATILLRALAYDDALKSRAGDQVAIVVLYDPGDTASRNESQAISGAFRDIEKLTIQGLPVRTLEMPFESGNGLAAKLKSSGVDAVYVCNGLASHVGALRKLAEEQRLITMGAELAYVKGGLVLGVFPQQNRPSIFLNLAASKRVGASFSSELVRLASIVE